MGGLGPSHGRWRQGARGLPSQPHPQKRIPEKYFSGKRNVKFRHFSGKCVKLGIFVKFSYIISALLSKS